MDEPLSAFGGQPEEEADAGVAGNSGIRCPECGTLNPPTARFCNGRGVRLEEPEEIVRPSGQETSDTMAEKDLPEPDEPRQDVLAAGEIEVETEVAESSETETADGGTTDDARSGVVAGADEEITTDVVELPEDAMPPDGSVAEPSEEPGSSSVETVVPIERLRQYRTVIIVAIVALAAVIIIAVALLYKPGVIVVPQGASDYVGQTASDVAGIFEELGFEDVMVIEVPNTAGASTGTVMRISIKGDAEFQAGESFPKEDRVVITEYGVATDSSPAAEVEMEEEEVEPEEDATEQSSGTSSDAGKTGEEDGLQYAIDDEGNVTITKCVSEDSFITINDEMDGHPVTKISASAFEGCEDLRGITIRADITELGPSAFKGCTSLGSISLPSSLTVIPDSAFEGCTSLSLVDAYGDLMNLGKACFKGCTELRNAYISSIERIGDSAFQGCTALIYIALQECEAIGPSAFQGCTALPNIIIPSDTTSIESKAFEGCTNLGTMTIMPDEDEITIAPDAFENCPKLHVIW